MWREGWWRAAWVLVGCFHRLVWRLMLWVLCGWLERLTEVWSENEPVRWERPAWQWKGEMWD